MPNIFRKIYSGRWAYGMPLYFNSTSPFQNRVIGYDLSHRRKIRTRSDADESIFFSTEADGGLYISMNNYMKWCEAIESGKFSNTPMIRNAWQGQTLVDTLQELWYGCGWFIRQPTERLTKNCLPYGF